MMILHLVSKNRTLLTEIADELLQEKLIANAMISDAIDYRSLDKNGRIELRKEYSCKAISKSLLFSEINDLLRSKYKNKTPLLYSEPIILIDSQQTEELLALLKKV